MTVAIKICGITKVEDARAAADLGAHAIGLVFYEPSPRYIPVEKADAVSRALPPFVAAVGLFVNAPAEYVRSVLSRVQLQMLQFHGDEAPEFCRGFGMPYLKAVRVRPEVDLLQYARRYGDARGLLLDAYVDGTHGGTGAVFDWALIPAHLPLPVVLSGGLTPANVEQAVRQVRPRAVDVSSGVEAARGVKDVAKIAAFISGVRNADV